MLPVRVRMAIIAPLCLFMTALDAADVEVRVEGVAGDAYENVLATLSIMRYRALPELNDTMVTRLHARAPREIREALAPFGYYNPMVEGTLETRPGGWHALYAITPGEPVRIQEVDIRIVGAGRDEPAFHNLGGLPARGTRLRHADYERLKQRLRQAASETGYLDATFVVSELRVSEAAGTADIILHYRTGDRFRFGTVTIEQDVLDERVVRRFIQFEEGDPFSLSRLLSLQYALSDSQYFRMVEVDASRSLAQGLDIPVTVRMQPAPRHRYTAGVGFATDTGPRGLAGWENRRVNSRGHRLGADLKLSRVYRSMTTRYIVPLRNPVWERLAIVTGYVREELGDVESERSELTIAWTHRIDRLQRTLSTTVSSERDLVGGVGLRNTQLTPGAEWSWSTGETGARPRSGRRFTLAFAGSAPALGAATSYLSGRMRGRFILPVGAQDRLLLTAEVGAIATADLDRVPATRRFFAGGDYSVRGYRYNSLGPEDTAGNVVGGRYLATLSAEWEHWLSDDWGIGLFVDHGGAFNRFSDDRYTGAGLGVRWQLPFGVFSLDFAHPFDDPSGRNVRFHLGLGVEL